MTQTLWRLAESCHEDMARRRWQAACAGWRPVSDVRVNSNIVRSQRRKAMLAVSDSIPTHDTSSEMHSCDNLAWRSKGVRGGGRQRVGSNGLRQTLNIGRYPGRKGAMR